MLLCLSRTTWHTNMDFPHIESIDRAFSVEYWLMESIISAWTIRFKTDFQTQNLGFLSRNTITVSQYIKTEKNYFLIHTCIWFSSNKIVARFPKYLRQITSWKAGWDDIRPVQWNSPHYLSATKLSIPSFPAAILSDMATMSAGRPTGLKKIRHET